MKTTRELATYIDQLRTAGQLGPIRENAQGVCVEIVRKTWGGVSRSTRIFPEFGIRKVGGEAYLVRLPS